MNLFVRLKKIKLFSICRIINKLKNRKHILIPKDLLFMERKQVSFINITFFLIKNNIKRKLQRSFITQYSKIRIKIKLLILRQ